jgi:hypothetical protein
MNSDPGSPGLEVSHSISVVNELANVANESIEIILWPGRRAQPRGTNLANSINSGSGFSKQTALISYRYTNMVLILA